MVEIEINNQSVNNVNQLNSKSIAASDYYINKTSKELDRERLEMFLQEPRSPHLQASLAVKQIHNPQLQVSTADNSVEIGDKEQVEA